MKRDVAEKQAAAAPPARVGKRKTAAVGTAALPERREAPHSPDDVEARYVAARDTWVNAMHAANSGKSADLASLALAQETYEAIAAEREGWLSGRVAIPIESSRRPNLDAIVGNELQWRRITTPREEPKGLLGRLKRRVTGR